MNTITPENDAFARAIEAMGGFTEAAKLLNFKWPSQVSNALKRGRCPPDWVLEVERLSGVSRHELRRDVFGPAPTDPDYRPALRPTPDHRAVVKPTSQPMQEAA